MANYALQTPPRVAHAKMPGPKKKLNDGNNNGQLRIANTTSGGARKAAWAKKERKNRERLNDGNNNGQAMHGTRKHAWRTQAA